MYTTYQLNQYEETGRLIQRPTGPRIRDILPSVNIPFHECFITFDDLGNPKVYKKPINNSISAYRHKHDGVIWIPNIYSNIKSFLDQDDRLSLCIAHDLQIEDKRPDPYKNRPEINPEYIMWSLRQMPKFINFDDPAKKIITSLDHYKDIRYKKFLYQNVNPQGFIMY